MKTAIAAMGNKFESSVDMHFARCTYFVILDHASGSIEFLPNPNVDKAEDAGVATVGLLQARNVQKVVAGDFGAKVKPLLDSLQIQMIVVRQASLTVNDIIKLLTGKKSEVMPKMDGTGPDGKGAGTGRGMGRCKKASQNEKLEQLGKGLGKKRQTGGGQGKGQRLQGSSGK
jgi:predicted Fe-Mo cluster-binding NifX family protein